MFTEAQLAELRLRAKRDKTEALLEELTRAHENAEETIRRSGEHPDDLRIDISRAAMRKAIMEVKRRLTSLEAALAQVEQGELDPRKVDLNALGGAWPGKSEEEDGPRDLGDGPQIP